MITQLILAVSVLFSIGAGINFFLSIGSAESAPQQAAGAAMALAMAGIPYMFARAMSAAATLAELRQLRELVESLRKPASPPAQ